jgi:hypothetical protein
VVGVAVSRMKYVHWPSAGFSSRSSQLCDKCQRSSSLAANDEIVTYTFDCNILSTSFSSPSATCITSSINPAPILVSKSEILRTSQLHYTTMPITT